MSEDDLTTFRIVAVSHDDRDIGFCYYQEWRSSERGDSMARKHAEKCATEGMWDHAGRGFIPPRNIARVLLRRTG